MFNGIGIQTIMEISKYDTWLAVILGIIIGFIPILLICYMNKKNVNFFDLINNLFGKTFSKIFLFIVIIFLFYSLITITNDFINFANVKYLFETPRIFIAILFVIPAIIICKKGCEALGRTGIILFIISVIIFFLNDIALIKLVKFNNLKPIYANGFMSILKGAIYYVVYMITPIIFLNIIPKSQKSYKLYNRNLIIGYLISSIAILVIVFYITTVYNYEYITLFSYPAYFTLKKINYGFLANVENIMSFFFIIDYFMTETIFLYSIYYFLGNELKLKNKKFKVISIIVTLLFIYLSVYIFKDSSLASHISKTFYILANLFLISFILIFVPIKIKLHKKN